MPANKSYKKGDLVQLKSGGPVMTIIEYSIHADRYDTSWFAGSKLEHGRFPPEALKDPEPKKPAKGE